jgi:integrase
MSDEITPTGNQQKALAQVTMADLMARWLRDLDVSPDTVRAYRISVERFAEWRADHPGQATPNLIRQWRDSHTSAATANLRLTALRSFYGWLVQNGYLHENPAGDVGGMRRRGTTKAHKRDALTNDEVAAVLSACGDGDVGIRDRAMIALMAYTALRAVEVHRADLEDLQAKGSRFVLWVQGKGRTDSDEYVILPSPAMRPLRAWLAVRDGDAGALFTSLSNRSRGERLSRSAIRRIVKARYREAGVVGDRKTTHSLRHSAISNAIRNGATPMQTRAMSRHDSLDTVMIYYHETARDENPAEDLIDYEG